MVQIGYTLLGTEGLENAEDENLITGAPILVNELEPEEA